MDEHPNRDGENQIPLIAWALCAFVPGIAGIACLGIKSEGQWVFPCLLLLNLGCSLAASFGLTARVKNDGTRVAVGMLLAIFLFFMNVAIVIFAGCSGTGRIAP
jgi:hypothetical protein